MKKMINYFLDFILCISFGITLWGCGDKGDKDDKKEIIYNLNTTSIEYDIGSDIESLELFLQNSNNASDKFLVKSDMIKNPEILLTEGKNKVLKIEYNGKIFELVISVEDPIVRLQNMKDKLNSFLSKYLSGTITGDATANIKVSLDSNYLGEKGKTELNESFILSSEDLSLNSIYEIILGALFIKLILHLVYKKCLTVRCFFFCNEFRIGGLLWQVL